MGNTFKVKDLKNPRMPWHGWILGGILLLFGILSAFDYMMSMTQGEAYYRSSGMTNSQISYFSNFPT